MGSGAPWTGVDVGGREKAFHVAFVDEALRVTLERAASVADCVAMLRRSGAAVVAIDAPSSWASPGERSRPSERWFVGLGLCGIRFTPDEATATARHDRYYEWIEHGLELWSACRDAGFTTIECFPTASWTAWIGSRKQRSRAVWTKAGIARLGDAGVRGADAATNQDERDAIAAALTACQWDQQPATTTRCEDFVVPRRETWPMFEETGEE